MLSSVTFPPPSLVSATLRLCFPVLMLLRFALGGLRKLQTPGWSKEGGGPPPYNGSPQKLEKGQGVGVRLLGGQGKLQ